MLQLLGADLIGQLLGSTLYLLGVAVGQAELGQDGVHLGIVGPRLPEDVQDNTLGVLGSGLPVRDLHEHLVASGSALELSLGDEDVLTQLATGRDEEGEASGLLQRTDIGRLRPLEDLGDARPLELPAAGAVAAEDDAVAMQCRREPPFVEGYRIQLGIIGDEARTPRTVVEAPLQA